MILHHCVTLYLFVYSKENISTCTFDILVHTSNVFEKLSYLSSNLHIHILYVIRAQSLHYNAKFGFIGFLNLELNTTVVPSFTNLYFKTTCHLRPLNLL